MTHKPIYRSLKMLLLPLCVAWLHADTVIWDGGGGDGLWITGDNWSGTPDNTTPANGDTVDIGGGASVSTAGISALHGANQLPNKATVNLTGNATLTDGTDGVLRLNGSTLNVPAGSTLTGGFWDLNGGTLSFEDGAIATMNHWEQKGTNVFNFELGAAGFTMLTPGTFRLGGGTTIADAIYNVDMAAYAGGTGVIALVDFSGDAAGMDNATFQGAGGLNILNYGGTDPVLLRWNDAEEAIELLVGFDFEWDGDASDGLWTTTTNWISDTLPTSGQKGRIGNGDTVTMDLGGGFPPAFLDITISGGSSLGDTGIYRLQAGTMTVEAGSNLGSGGFWDLDDGTFNFKDGATVNMGNWEQKDTNRFHFELSAGGFTAITPGTFRIGNGSLTADIANATYSVDMAAYTGGPGVITLVDFASDAASMDNSKFQGAGGLDVWNVPTGLSAVLQWNDTTEAIELSVTPEGGIPNIIDITLDVDGNVVLTLDGSEAGLTAQASDDLSSGSFVDLASTPGTNTLTIDAAEVDPDGDGADFYRVRN